MKYTFYIFILLFLGGVSAQKTIKKSILNPVIRSIQVDTNNCFEVLITTADVAEVSAEVSIEGEYKDDLLLKIVENGATLVISAGFQPNFINLNDKLSAHKVVSISMRITIPEYKIIQMYGTSSNLRVRGSYEHIKISLSDGKCILDNVDGSIEVITQSGDISVVSSAATINAKSKYGVISRENIPEGNTNFLLTTTTGDIDLHKTK